MEEMTVVGYRQVDFSDNGKHITGISLFVNHPDVGVTGELAEKLFISTDRLDMLGYSPVIGSKIVVTWGRHNRIIGIKTVKATARASRTGPPPGASYLI